MDKEALMERLEASKRVTEAARRESNCLEKQVEELERKLQSSQGQTQESEEKLQMFLKKVAGLLQVKSESVILPAEKDILQKLDKVRNQWGFLTQHDLLAWRRVLESGFISFCNSLCNIVKC